jgi:hypothetical protein
MKEAELLILSAETVSHGRAIAYEVKLEAGDTPADKLSGGSLFIDDLFFSNHTCQSMEYSWNGRACVLPSFFDNK